MMSTYLKDRLDREKVIRRNHADMFADHTIQAQTLRRERMVLSIERMKQKAETIRQRNEEGQRKQNLMDFYLNKHGIMLTQRDLDTQLKFVDDKHLEYILERKLQSKREHDAAVIIQKNFKSQQTRRAYQAVQQIRLRATKCIQNFWKNFQRLHFFPKHIKMIKEKSAVTIQKYLKGYSTYRKVQKLKIINKFDECFDYFSVIRNQLLEDSQIKIAYAWKRYKVRKQKKLELKRKRDAEEALRKKKKKNNFLGLQTQQTKTDKSPTRQLKVAQQNSQTQQQQNGTPQAVTSNATLMKGVIQLVKQPQTGKLGQSPQMFSKVKLTVKAQNTDNSNQQKQMQKPNQSPIISSAKRILNSNTTLQIQPYNSNLQPNTAQPKLNINSQESIKSSSTNQHKVLQKSEIKSSLIKQGGISQQTSLIAHQDNLSIEDQQQKYEGDDSLKLQAPLNATINKRRSNNNVSSLTNIEKTGSSITSQHNSAEKKNLNLHIHDKQELQMKHVQNQNKTTLPNSIQNTVIQQALLNDSQNQILQEIDIQENQSQLDISSDNEEDVNNNDEVNDQDDMTPFTDDKTPYQISSQVTNQDNIFMTLTQLNDLDSIPQDQEEDDHASDKNDQDNQQELQIALNDQDEYDQEDDQQNDDQD
eukprot:403370654